MSVRHTLERTSATTRHDAVDEAITNAFTAVEPLIRVVSRWPHVAAPVYVVVVDRPGHPLRDLVISDMPRDKWPAPFDDVVRGKAALTARTRMPSRLVLQDRLDLLRRETRVGSAASSTASAVSSWQRREDLRTSTR